MNFENQLIVNVLLALLAALVVSFLMTPVVKTFAYKVGAIDVPKDNRRMHKVPIPRLGGLAIFIGFKCYFCRHSVAYLHAVRALRLLYLFTARHIDAVLKRLVAACGNSCNFIIAAYRLNTLTA